MWNGIVPEGAAYREHPLKALHDEPAFGAGLPPSDLPLTDLNAGHRPLRGELVAAFERVLDSGRFVSGPEVEAFEGAMAAYVGTDHAVAVASGTAALTLALMGAGIGAGDEVILPANTFFATAEAVVATGAVPVVADVVSTSASIDPESVAALVTSRTRAVIAVHLYGHPVDVPRLRAVTARHGLFLLEDAAQAMGASWGGHRVGSLGDAAAFSFFPTKILGALGEGGAVTTDDCRLAEQVRLLRSHGEAVKNVSRLFGFNERMDEVQAALLMVKLSRLDDDLVQRGPVVDRYTELLADVDGVGLFELPAPARSVHHLMVVTVPERDRVLAELHAADVGAAVHYPTPVHLQPTWSTLGLPTPDVPNAEALARSVLSLPLYSQMTPAQVERCVTALDQAVHAVKVALVGLGYWGEKILRNLVGLVGSENVLGVDARADRRSAARSAFPAMACAADVDDALGDQDVEAVVLATPAATHSAIGLRVLRGGRHLLVEKPLATSVPDAEALVQLAGDRHLTLMVGHTFLFSPRVEVVTASVRDGRVGRIHYASMSRLNLGLYQDDINVIWDLAPHDFSILFHVLQEFPVAVQTMARNSRVGGMPDVAFMHLRFPSGAIASSSVSWRAPRKIRSMVLVGDGGMVVYDDTQPDEPIKLYDRGVVGLESSSFGENQLTYRFGDTISPHVSAVEPLSIQLRHFLSCVKDGSACLSDGRFGLEVVRALECADRSWQLGGVPVAVGSGAVKRSA